MMRLTGTRLGAIAVLAFGWAALLWPAMAPASVTYPNGGSGFQQGAEGWSAGEESCMPAELLCTSEAAYDAGTGSPPGSIAAQTTVTVNLIGLFKGVATWVSPQFTVPVGTITGARLHLERSFDPGGLIDVGPQATYAVALDDLSAGTSTAVLGGKAGEGDEAFAGESAPAAVIGGHTYRLTIEAVTAQSTLALSLLSGTTSLNFDNVGLTVDSSPAGGGGGGAEGAVGRQPSKAKGNSLASRRLLALLRRASVSSPVLLKGRRLLVRVSCPSAIHRACHVVAQGMLSKRRAATAKRVVKLPRGRGRRVVLRVKPRARRALVRRKRLLVREKVRAGTAHATLFTARKLIRR